MTLSPVTTLAFGIAVILTTSVEARAADFPSIVNEVIGSQTSGPVSRMSDAKKKLLISCVNKVLIRLPAAKQRYVVQATTFDDREHRFGVVVMENRAEWKQKIAKACSSIAVQGGI